MASRTSMLHDEEVKEKATAALAAMGLSASDAVRLLFHRIVADQAFPLGPFALRRRRRVVRRPRQAQ